VLARGVPVCLTEVTTMLEMTWLELVRLLGLDLLALLLLALVAGDAIEHIAQHGGPRRHR
jgi:hypothetical protein